MRESVLRIRFDQALSLAAVLTASAAVSSPALSADVINDGPPPLLSEAPSPVSLNLFAGWWIGGTLGGATANFDSSQSNATIDSSGVLGGITGGWNWQNGPIVISFEGDALGAGISGSGRFNNGANVANPNIDAMADLRLRAGVTVVPQVLLFVTGGGDWADVDLPVSGRGGGWEAAPSSAGASAVALRLHSLRTGARASTISSPTSTPIECPIPART